MVDWEPLQDPTAFTGVLKRWRKALRIADAAEPDLQLNIYGQHDASRTRSRQSAKTVMSPYDSLLWNVWMPKIRSAINNEWKPSHPRAAVALLEAWNALLPRFVLDNITDQLLLPKIRGAVADWDPRRSKTPLHNIIFPWLPLLGDRMTDLLSDARRRLKGMLQAWKVIDGVPQYLSEWKDVSRAFGRHPHLLLGGTRLIHLSLSHTSGILNLRLGLDAPQQGSSQTRRFPPGRFPRRPAFPKHGTTGTRLVLAQNATNERVQPLARDGVFPEMARGAVSLAIAEFC